MCNIITKKHREACGVAVLPFEASGIEKIIVGKYMIKESHWIRERFAIIQR
jgi:hypothetical protein